MGQRRLFLMSAPRLRAFLSKSRFYKGRAVWRDFPFLPFFEKVV